MLSSNLAMFSVDRAAVGYSRLGTRAVGSPIDASMSILAASTDPIITFAMGSPAADAIPVEEFANAFGRIMSSNLSRSAFDYSPTEGNPALRRALLARLEALGQPTEPDCLLITAGGMQGLDLVFRLFLEPDDLVIAESPSYSNGTATARNHGANVLQIPLDGDGLDLEAADRAVRDAGRSPKILYLIPTYQNPSGASYSIARRLEVLAFARKVDALIIEDDPYSELRYEGEEYPSLQQLDQGEGRVIQVRTFSKILAPGLRVGWTIAPRDVTNQMVRLRQTMDTCANSLGQLIVASLIESRELDAHIQRLRTLYPVRRDMMDRGLRATLDENSGVSWSRPQGGMFMWLELPAGVDGDAVFALGIDRGVAIVPGSAFDRVKGRHALRLCFTAADPETLDEGLQRLHDSIAEAAVLHTRNPKGAGGGQAS
jgi:2-aminoadipate transaminase